MLISCRRWLGYRRGNPRLIGDWLLPMAASRRRSADAEDSSNGDRPAI